MKHKIIESLSGNDSSTQARKDFIKVTMLRDDIDLETKIFYIEAHWSMTLLFRGVDSTQRSHKMISNTIIEAI